MALERHIGKLQPHNIPEPGEPTRVSIPYGDGTVSATYKPGAQRG